MNRFAAMDTCRSLITSVNDQDLGMEIAAWIPKFEGSFVSRIEPIECRSDHIRRALQGIREDD